MLRGFFFTFGFVFSIAVMGFILPFLQCLPLSKRVAFLKRWARLVLAWMAFTGTVQTRVMNAFPERLNGCILIANHQSTWETLWLFAHIPNPCFVLKQELLWIPFFGWGLAMTQPIAIPRHDPEKARASINTQGKKALAEQRTVIIFPEGARSKDPYAVQAFKKGAVMLAQHCHVPIATMVHNAGRCWPAGSTRLYTGIIHVFFGPTFLPPHHNAEEVNQALYTWTKDHLKRLFT